MPTVTITKTASYNADELKRSVVKSLAPLGGLEHFVKPGMKVLLKPNLLSAKEPHRAITTHPQLVATVARMVIELGAEVLVGDSPGGGKSQIQRVWDNTGFSAMAEREGLKLVNFELAGTEPHRRAENIYHIARPILEADLVINLPKLKTHVLTLMTGALKNTFGAIPGFRKGMYHKEAPNPRSFAHIVVDIYSIVQPGLTIMDAILAMEGDGPSSGEPRQLGLLMASSDAVALDTVAASVIGLPPEKVHVISYAAEAGLGIGHLGGIKIAGCSLDEVKVDDFKLTSNLKLELMPKFVFDMVTPFVWLLPQVDKGGCTGCSECVAACPTDALEMSKSSGTPVLEKELCINCWCCHEICPTKAISIDASWLAKKLVR